MTNDNVKKAVSLMKPTPDFTQHVLYKQVLALLEVEKAARALFDEISPSDCSPAEQVIFATLADQHLSPDKNRLMMDFIEQLLLFTLPGPDIIANVVGLSPLTDHETGEKAVAIVLQIQPGKNAVRIMDRAKAEIFEKSFTASLDNHFGRIHKL